MAGIRKIIGDSCAQHRHLRRDMRRDQHDHYEVSDDVLGKIKSALPYFEGNYDPRAYINWELAVDSEFQKHVLSEKQKVMCASSVLIKHASNDWKHLCRHNKIPQSWKYLKRYFRDVYVPMYYADILFNKLQCLKQDTRTVTSYYHDMQACLLRCGLDECEEAKELRFLCGLNKEIQDMLDCQRYTSLSHLLQLACNAESKIEERDMKEPPIPLFTLKVKAPPSSEEDIKGKVNGIEINHGECIVNEVNLSTFHTKVEQPLVESNAGIPLSQVDLLAVPCDKEELCDNASLISMPQLVNEHDISRVSLCADFKHAVHIANEVEERIRLICTGKINNPWRGVSIAKAQHNVLYGCSRIVNVFSTNRSYLNSPKDRANNSL
uniref:Putative gag-pol polyprotein n=1 Tax=Oryza sativa subsp. japonica TaxID=39947 RepID=Q6UUA4_ORYSJ|nr:putative gag-pol polyprotein [Oryza sativa Japonica Group]